MRWTWRCRMCAVGWVVGVYMCAVGLITLINMTDPSIQRAYAKLNQATSAGTSWGWTNRRSGRGARLPWCNTLRFRHPPGPNTALTSFPGSGNTWLRYLLQQSTGYYTGSVYKDYALMKNGFPAESINNGSVVVVKTHELGSQVHKGFFRAILILRDPYQAIQAEFNRQSGGHIGHAQPEKYTRNHGKYWEDFVTNKAIAWMNTALDWLKFVGPLHLVFYEDLLDNLPEEMRRILEFLEVDVDEKSFDCMIRHKDGIYKRRHKTMGFDPYTPKLRTIVERCKAVVDKAAKEFLAGGDVKMVLATMNDTVATAANPHAAAGGGDGGEGAGANQKDRKGRVELLKSVAGSSR